MSEPVELHQPCDDCGSSDALTIYDDGHRHCFSCDKTTQGDGRATPSKPVGKSPLITGGDFKALIRRKISQKTTEKFKYGTGQIHGKTVQIAPYYNATGTVVAQKIRFPDKGFVVMGDLKEAGLFGQQLWRDGGKRLVITEGEIDALSYAQATNLSWPVVSVPNGASGAKKAVAQQIEWLERFDQVVFLFDMDEPGQAAARECAELLTPGKAAVAHMPLKDASEMLMANRVKDLCVCVWEAKTLRPDGIVNGNQLWDTVSEPVEMGTPYPWTGLNKLLFGLRPREIVTLSAGTGIGKSAVCSEIAYHIAQTIGERVGYVALEEGMQRTALRFMGMAVNKPLHLPGYELSDKERRAAFDATLGTGLYSFYDHFGSLDSENLLYRLRYLVQAEQCKFLVLDHLSIVVSGMSLDGDERRMLDHTMTALRSFTEQTNVSLLLVSHLKRPQGMGHEEGAKTSLAQLRGSAAIGQLSDAVIGLERNQQADGVERNEVVVRVLKNRYAGLTGITTTLRYDPATGRLNEVGSAAADFEENNDAGF